MELIAWSDISADDKNNTSLVHDWFMAFKEQFDKIDAYEQKLQFWYMYTEGLNHALTWAFSHFNQKLDGYSNLTPTVRENISNLKDDLVSIQPKDVEEFRLFFWGNVERGVKKYKQFKDTHAEVIIRSYWQDIRTSLSPKDLLKIEIDRVDEVILKSYPDKRSEQGLLFHKGYNSTIRGKDAISDFYNDEIAPGEKTKYYHDSDAHFIHLARGIANARLKVFFAEQAERLNRGEDISKPAIQKTSQIESNETSTVTWSALSEQEQERFSFNYEKFENYLNVFSRIESYKDRLQFWLDNNLRGLTYVIDLDKKTVSQWLGMYYMVFMHQNNPYLTCISIEPQSPEQCKEFITWSIEKNDLNGCNDWGCYSQSMINLYWERILKVPAYREYPKNQLSEIERFVENQQKANKEILNALFVHSYNNCMNGLEPFFYNELYRLLFANASHHDIHLIGDSCILFPNLLRGKAYAEYRGFLLDQIERANRGEDIRKPEMINTPPISELASNSNQLVRLQWNSNKSVLTDIFRQLKQTNASNGKPLLSSSFEDVAVFLKANFDCYASTKLSSIVSTLKHVDRPHVNNRIDIYPHRDENV